MGIQGLIPFLKNAAKPCNIKEFKGCTVAIDSYCWLHKGAFACAEKLAMGEQTQQYVHYCMKYVNSLLNYGIKPILVFDGCHLPSKQEVERQRRERRETYRKKARQLLRDGLKSEARDALQKCVDITSQMALDLMNACREKGVDCIVAPYEADAQLAYLSKTGIAQVIITEDSDLILFGCEKIMFKMDFAGNGILVEKSNLGNAMDLQDNLYTFDKFRYMCILSGCDYLPSLPGIGLKKANKIFQKTRQTDLSVVLRKIPSLLNMNSLTVSSEYIEGFFKANATFLYQLVFDPRSRTILPLNPYPEGVTSEEFRFAGPHLSADFAYQLALGNIDVNTKEQIAEFDPETFQPKSSWSIERPSDKPYLLSIWDKDYQPYSQSMKTVERTGSLIFNTPSLKGKEVIIKNTLNLPKKSPGKRIREEPTPLSNSELAQMYIGSSGNEEFECPAKKCRMETSDEVINCTSMPQLAETTLTSVGVTSPPPKTPVKPPRNVFKVTQPSPAKEKFSLDGSAPVVECRSRFFTSNTAKNTTILDGFVDSFKASSASDPKVSAVSPPSLKNSCAPSTCLETRQPMHDENNDPSPEKQQSPPVKPTSTPLIRSKLQNFQSSYHQMLPEPVQSPSLPRLQSNPCTPRTSYGWFSRSSSVSSLASQHSVASSVDTESFGLSQAEEAESSSKEYPGLWRSTVSSQDLMDNSLVEQQLVDSIEAERSAPTTPKRSPVGMSRHVGLRRPTSTTPLMNGQSKLSVLSSCRKSGLARDKKSSPAVGSQRSMKDFLSQFSRKPLNNQPST